MGPRGSALICGYTNYHRRLESCLAELKKKEVSDLPYSGFSLDLLLFSCLLIASLNIKILPDRIFDIKK